MQTRHWLAAFLAALIGSVIGLIAILPLSLGVHELVIFPLALAVSALFAALAAGWVGTWLATDGSRTQLMSTVASMEAMAALLAVTFIALLTLQVTFFMPPIRFIAIGSLLLALAASVATVRSRHSAQDSSADVRLTVMLLLVAVVSVPLVIFLASLFGMTGA